MAKAPQKGSSNGSSGAGSNGNGPVAQGQPTKAATAARRPGFTIKPSKQSCIALGALTGLMVLSSIGLYVWRSQEIAKIEAIVEQKHQEVANGEQIARRLTQVEADYAGMSSQLRYLETSVTEGQYVPTLLKQMEGMAKSTNLQVNGVRPTLEPAPPPPSDKEKLKEYKPWPYDKLHVEMDVKGSYWSVAKLLYRLTEFPKIMAVESVSITPQTAQTGYNPSLNVKMKLTGFIFKNENKTSGPNGSDPNAPGAAPNSAAKTAFADPTGAVGSESRSSKSINGGGA
jgi:Tfp pilus assembly protein PilO